MVTLVHHWTHPMLAEFHVYPYNLFQLKIPM